MIFDYAEGDLLLSFFKDKETFLENIKSYEIEEEELRDIKISLYPK